MNLRRNFSKNAWSAWRNSSRNSWQILKKSPEVIPEENPRKISEGTCCRTLGGILQYSLAVVPGRACWKLAFSKYRWVNSTGILEATEEILWLQGLEELVKKSLEETLLEEARCNPLRNSKKSPWKNYGRYPRNVYMSFQKGISWRTPARNSCKWLWTRHSSKNPRRSTSRSSFEELQQELLKEL